jgi:hypothetical protein
MIGTPTIINATEAKGFSEDQNHRAVVVAYQCSVCNGISVGMDRQPEEPVGRRLHLAAEG